MQAKLHAKFQQMKSYQSFGTHHFILGGACNQRVHVLQPDPSLQNLASLGDAQHALLVSVSVLELPA